jgi:PKD repeat protein
MSGRRAKVLSLALLGLGTVNGCNCDPPNPVVHVSPGTTVQAGTTVTFDSNRIAGDPPDNIDFNTNLAWDLNGDGQFEVHGQRVVERRFDTPGTYPVTFDASNLVVDRRVLARSQFVHGYVTKQITVVPPPGQQGNQSPTASFTEDHNPWYTENDIKFDGSASHDPDGQIVKYEWDWTADGTYDQSGAAPTATHKYAFANTYTVRLRVTDDAGATGVTEGTVQVMDGVPPGKVIAQEATGVSAASTGTPFTLALNRVRPSLGTTTVAGTKLVIAGIRAHGRIRFTRVPKLLGRHHSPRYAAILSLVQRGNASKAKFSGQGYILLSFTKRDALCLAGTGSGSLTTPFIGKLATAGGKGFGARVRGTGTFSPPTLKHGKPVLNGRLKLRKVHKPRTLPKACRKLVRDLPR